MLYRITFNDHYSNEMGIIEIITHEILLKLILDTYIDIVMLECITKE